VLPHVRLHLQILVPRDGLLGQLGEDYFEREALPQKLPEDVGFVGGDGIGEERSQFSSTVNRNVVDRALRDREGSTALMAVRPRTHLRPPESSEALN
jgi:hypothetical protein